MVAIWERRDYVLQAVTYLRGPAMLLPQRVDGVLARQRVHEGDARAQILHPETRQGGLEEAVKLDFTLPGQFVERSGRPLDDLRVGWPPSAACASEYPSP